MARVMGTAKEEARRERWQLVLKLRFMDKTFKEIGDTLGVSGAMARNLYMRALKEQAKHRVEKMFIDWRVGYDYRILVDIIDDIRGIANDGKQG